MIDYNSKNKNKLASGIENLIFKCNNENITNKIFKKYLCKDKIYIKNFDKDLVINETIKVKGGIPIEIDLKRKNKEVIIVYFINIGLGYPPHQSSLDLQRNIFNPPKWNNLFIEQFEQLKKCGLYAHATQIYIVASHREKKELQLIRKIVKNKFDKALILAHKTPRLNGPIGPGHEYDGLHKIWELSTENPNAYYLYFHSKGITHGETKIRKNLEEYVIADWKNIIEILDLFSSIQKLGSISSKEGWFWYNYWWAKGEYLSELKEPDCTPNRWYYESWLGRSHPNPTYHNCFNKTSPPPLLAPPPLFNIGTFWDPK